MFSARDRRRELHTFCSKIIGIRERSSIKTDRSWARRNDHDASSGAERADGAAGDFAAARRPRHAERHCARRLYGGRRRSVRIAHARATRAL